MESFMARAVQQMGLGLLTGKPEAVAGGLMHRLYRICCGGKSYAVKILNAQIMRRPEAIGNMAFAEGIAKGFAGMVPAVYALEKDGKQLQQLEGRFFLVYPWQQGESIFAPCIGEEHCLKMGRYLGRIHKIALRPEKTAEGENRERTADTWPDLSGWPDAPWAAALAEALPALKRLRIVAESAAAGLWQEQVISHRDLDPKNVLWHKGEAFLIDWEAAGPVNPWLELAECLFYWTVTEQGEADEGLFHAFMTGYCEEKELSAMPVEAAFCASFGGMLAWLLYNARRACGVEAADEEERAMGAEQVLSTLKDIQQKETLAEKYVAWLKEMQCAKTALLS